MKTFKALATTLAFAAGAVGAATPALAQDGLNVPGLSRVTDAFGDSAYHGRFTLFQHDTSQEFIAIGNPSTGVGNLYIFGGDVLNHQGGKQVGRSAGQCANSSETEILCTAAIGAGDGQINIQGMVSTQTFYTGAPTEFAITGGTGPYRTARGTVTTASLR